MRSILVAGQDPNGFSSVLSTAFLVAQRFGSHIEGVATSSRMNPFAVAEGMSAAVTSALETIEAAESERIERLRNLFRDFMQAENVGPIGGQEEETYLSADWPLEESLDAVSLGHHGRLFDLIVVGRPERGKIVAGGSIVEAALFDTGRPVLIAPPSPPGKLGHTVIVAWNGSTESARAVRLAMPFLESADNVFVIEVKEGMVPGPSAAEVREYLSRSDIASQARLIETGGRSVGQAILDEVTSLGADLIVKGAYTHSRLRQMFFGGATSHILGDSNVPVLMVH